MAFEEIIEPAKPYTVSVGRTHTSSFDKQDAQTSTDILNYTEKGAKS